MMVLFVILIYYSVNSTQKEFETCSIHHYEDTKKIDFRAYKQVAVSASSLYESNLIKDLIQGENYREAWQTTVKAPIVFLDTLFGGMTIIKEGGGKQTHSLRLKSKKGILYTLRSINKNPKKLIPEFARNLGLENIVVDGISSQHPYAAPIVAKLAETAEILHTHPKVVFVPKQERLGGYNEKFGNRLYLLEYESEGKVNWTHLPNVMKILDTEDLQKLKMENPDSLKIDAPALVRARLFDLLIGDWDRHAKQWGWAVMKSSKGYLAKPIPADRDNAFFKVDGIIPTLLSNENIVPELRPFKNEIEFMEGLVYDFDVYFLKNTPLNTFLSQALYIQEKLTDEKIDEALAYWNTDLRELYAAEIKSKIIARRERLQEFSREFKRVLDSRSCLDKPLKGSETDDISESLLKCFECY